MTVAWLLTLWLVCLLSYSVLIADAYITNNLKGSVLALSQAIFNSENGNVIFVLREDIHLTHPLPPLVYNASLTIQGACKGRRCIIDGQSSVVGFTCSNGGALSLVDVELRNFVNGAIRGGCGGVGVPYGLIVKRVTLRGNTGRKGGAIRLSLASAQILESEFLNNKAVRNGGAIWAHSGNSLDIFNSTFVGNTAGIHGGALGGSISSVRNCSFVQNSAGRGGAIYSANIVSMGVYSSAFIENTAAPMGGQAIYFGTGTYLPTGIVNFICSSSFIKPNTANVSEPAIYASIGSFNSTLRMCKNSQANIFAGSSTSVVSTCLGCSGCGDSDCGSNGDCMYSSVDGSPSCKCSGARDPTSNCVECLRGFSPASGCSTCVPGFLPKLSKPKGSTASPQLTCNLCAGIGKSRLPDPDVYPIIGGGPSPSAAACKALCIASQDVKSPVLDEVLPCQLWSHLDSTASECKNTCMLWYTVGACENTTITRVPSLGLTFGEVDLGSCGP